MEETIENKMASEKKNARDTTPRNNNNEKNEPRYKRDITLLNKEVDSIKEIIKVKDYIIEDLITELSEACDARKEFKAKYEYAVLQIKEARERIKHLENEREGLKQEVDLLNGDVKSLAKHVNDHELACTCAKEEENETEVTTMPNNHDATNSSDINMTDSGVDLDSLTKLVDDCVDAKLRGRGEPPRGTTTNSEKERVETLYARRTGSTDKTVPYTSDNRQLNVIIHGIKEENTESDRTTVEDLFNTVGIEYAPTTSATDRLGSKSSERTRPIRICMKTQEAKSSFMTSLGKLKDGPDTFKKISVTDDYTQEERKEIKRWIEEAKARSRNECDYVWKVRGSPNNNLRLIRMKKEQTRSKSGS